MRGVLRRVAIMVIACGIVAGVLAAVAYCAWHRYRYPYGSSHCCLRMMVMALDQYAYDNDGRYPAGRAPSPSPPSQAVA